MTKTNEPIGEQTVADLEAEVAALPAARRAAAEAGESMAEVARRSEELPGLIWRARRREHEALISAYETKLAEAVDEAERSGKAADKAVEKLQRAQREHDEIIWDRQRRANDVPDLRRDLRRMRGQLDGIERQGPDPSAPAPAPVARNTPYGRPGA